MVLLTEGEGRQAESIRIIVVLHGLTAVVVIMQYSRYTTGRDDDQDTPDIHHPVFRHGSAHSKERPGDLHQAREVGRSEIQGAYQEGDILWEVTADLVVMEF